MLSVPSHSAEWKAATMPTFWATWVVLKVTQTETVRMRRESRYESCCLLTDNDRALLILTWQIMVGSPILVFIKSKKTNEPIQFLIKACKRPLHLLLEPKHAYLLQLRKYLSLTVQRAVRRSNMATLPNTHYPIRAIQRSKHAPIYYERCQVGPWKVVTRRSPTLCKLPVLVSFSHEPWTRRSQQWALTPITSSLYIQDFQKENIYNIWLTP